MAVCALTMLDGVGDEVTVAGGAVLLALALILAWLSTHVAERGDHILGTILTAGAHVSLIGLGGGDAYIGGPSGPDASEPPPASRPQEDKPDDEDPDAGEAAGEGEGASGANVDQLLNIQGLRKRAAGAGSKPRPSPADKPEEEEEEEENEEGEADRSPKQVTAITVRLKFINDTEELAVLRPQDTVGLLKSKYFSGQERQIKLIFQGQLLQDPGRTLVSLNITHNSVIHCHVSQSLREGGAEGVPRPVPGAAQAEPGGVGVGGSAGGVGLALNTGSLVVPVFVVMLAVVWYFRINYRQFFTAPATISLVGVTIFFSFLIFGMYSR
ncbi:transmembrane and ubiquitin-like domain-containing protein 2 isoform X1 [Anguilla anguilla]|uniref:transmembrane and ubiquitin-like domain-containing protein 2 isoform X1 n=1 Tax=Anguilla anguilla TaxID=7936 RepID=UPI0015B28EE7|nr:transmembrane and ubiquitin-like domain-containing protein 2 isoform X1 [Anguilla anguilla]XP_035262394.1 transmembrane and ubiquitin-like domain-containing protein 2 isoform X1 [Anguilla anguilla]